MSSRARNRPPRLQPHLGPQHVAPPPTLPELLERSHVAGHASASSPSEVRRWVERAAAGRAHPVPLDDAWASVYKVFGATAEDPSIDPDSTIDAANRAIGRVSEVASATARVAFATSRPASLLPFHLA